MPRSRMWLTKQNRRGITLVELIVVVAIMAVVIMAIWSTFLFTNRTFTTTVAKATLQFDSRYAVDQLRKQVGLSSTVTVFSDIPATIPNSTTIGYAYINSNNSMTFRYRNATGPTTLLSRLNQSTADVSTPATIRFSPSSKNIGVRLTIGAFIIDTSIFAENMKPGVNVLYAQKQSDGTFITSTPTTAVSGPYIQFS